MGEHISCSRHQTCPIDYLSIVVTSITSITIFLGVCFLWWKRRTPEVKAKQVSLLVIQAVGSILWLISLLMTNYVSRFEKHGLWLMCYLWQVWVESPFGYCLVVSCYLARAYRLYHVFVRRRLPCLRSWHVVLLLLVPSILSAAVVQWRRPFKREESDNLYWYCSANRSWWLFITAVHTAYICVLIVSTWLLRNIRFEFNESKELLASVCASLSFLGVWMALLFVGFYRKRRDHFEESFRSVASYILVFLGSVTALCFSFFPVLRPLKAYLGQMKKQNDLDSMGQALGVPASGMLHPYTSFRFDEPFEALLQHKRFKQAFQAFADSRMAGESVRFYFEVGERNRVSNTVARIYMAQHIIETFVEDGSPLEINISHAMRSDILGTKDLSNPTLFDRAANEAINIMQTNLEHDFWQSPNLKELKEEIDSEAEFAEQLEWMNVSSKRDSFSNPDNLFEQNGSPQFQLTQGSLSPIHRAFLLAPSAILSPETVENNTNQSVAPSRFPNFQEQNLSHHHPKHTQGGG